MEFDAVVLAGGGSVRFGGVDKAMVVLEGVSLLDRVLMATADAVSTVVVGAVRTTYREVAWTVEEPPAGGPVAGLAAGLEYGVAPVVVVVSCDLPWITRTDITTLVKRLDEPDEPHERGEVRQLDGFGLRDKGGREQWLAAAYRRGSLVEAVRRVGDPRDKSVRRTLAGLELAWTAPTQAGNDVDTWSDLDT
ncbi:molybdenum cofactor guanylyltransferase [Kribbella solani]|uniref:Molybdopterin-guanine dinucleotide biosynthesis protein A n=1 Tax=Kribbella solani TaxID=236067 RepID=A0A841DZY5_9ACTN|nr:molybdopterin-guanine dinucleotide biosynthesis protein A [Kribbella solani]